MLKNDMNFRAENLVFCLLWCHQQTFFTPFWLVSHDDPAFMKNRRADAHFFALNTLMPKRP